MKNFTCTSAALACLVLMAGVTPAHAYEGDMVRLSQHRLADLGYFSGRFDGVLGPLTMASLRDFQASNGLWASGQLDSQTYNLLVAEDTRIWNGSATQYVYASAYQQPAIIHYANENVLATRYVTPTPVAYYVATTPSTVYYTPAAQPDMVEVSYNTVNTTNDSCAGRNYGNCRRY